MPDQEHPNLTQVPDKKLTSDRYPELLDAVEILYIKNNLSARVRFIQDWPNVAQRILGAELIGYDTDGADDLDRRAVLEDEAEARRLEFYDVLKHIEERSVVKGVLQLDYVENLVKDLQRDFASLVYAPYIIDKFLGSAPKVEEPEVKSVETSEAEVAAPIAPEAPAPKPEPAPENSSSISTTKKVTAKFTVMPKNDMPDVRPIDTPAPPEKKES